MILGKCYTYRIILLPHLSGFYALSTYVNWRPHLQIIGAACDYGFQKFWYRRQTWVV
jgi:hypothetical protein